MKMHRKIYHLTVRQVELLEAEAKELGLSVAEVLRRILDDHFRRKEQAV